MKALRIGLVSIVTLAVVLGLSNTASARTHVSVGVGIGYPGFYGGYHHYYGHGWGWRHHPRDVVVFGGYWGWPGYYDYYPNYYPGYVVAPPPVVVERPPVAVQQQPVVVQPQTIDKNTLKKFEDLRYKKSELLRMLAIGDKEHRIQALNELAGFSFDDNVRGEIEKVLASDPDAELRAAAAESLGQVKNSKAIPALEKARVNDSEASVRQAADDAIKNIEAN
jgi:hypothetical protein